MALIKCPECGKEISDKARACPSCGVPLYRSTVQPQEHIKHKYIVYPLKWKKYIPLALWIIGLLLYLYTTISLLNKISTAESSGMIYGIIKRNILPIITVILIVIIDIKNAKYQEITTSIDVNIIRIVTLMIFAFELLFNNSTLLKLVYTYEYAEILSNPVLSFFYNLQWYNPVQYLSNLFTKGGLISCFYLLSSLSAFILSLKMLKKEK